MSDYTGRELDIMYREAFEAGQEQGRADMVSERDRLRDALQEAISEIGCLVHPEFMSDSKWKKHKLWIDSLKAALQEAGDD